MIKQERLNRSKKCINQDLTISGLLLLDDGQKVVGSGSKRAFLSIAVGFSEWMRDNQHLPGL